MLKKTLSLLKVKLCILQPNLDLPTMKKQFLTHSKCNLSMQYPVYNPIQLQNKLRRTNE